MASQRRIRISREGVCYLLVVAAVLIGAMARQLNLLMLLGSTLAGPLVFSMFYGRLALRRLGVTRRLPSSLSVERRLKVDVGVTNRRRWLAIWAIEVEDQVRREGAAAGQGEVIPVGVYFPRIGGRETAEIAYEGRLRRRGRYRFGPLRVSTRFPLGLVRHSLILDQDDELIVYPRLGRLTHDWARVPRDNASGSQSLQRRGQLESDFYGLRDWRPGDNRRWIHWRTSARRGSLVVRQFEQRRSQDLALLVDLWQPASYGESEAANVETAVSFLATLVADACRQQGRKLTLHVAAQSPLEAAGIASPMFFREQMESLAVVEAHHDSGFPVALANALATMPRSMPTLLVSTRAVDWDAVRAAAGAHELDLAERRLRAINVGSDELLGYYHA